MKVNLLEVCKRSGLDKISGIFLVEDHHKLFYLLSKDGFSNSKEFVVVGLNGKIIKHKKYIDSCKFNIIGPMEVPENFK